eukprot:8011231-Alexandrium_andersonii.AAC.1
MGAADVDRPGSVTAVVAEVVAGRDRALALGALRHLLGSIASTALAGLDGGPRECGGSPGAHALGSALARSGHVGPSGAPPRGA